MEKYEAICTQSPSLARLLVKSNVTKLITDNGNVVGVEYVKGGQTFKEYGPVIISTGGFGADFSENSLLSKHRPDLKHLPTTNGDHCTGDGMKMAEDVGANLTHMKWVQVHPTGLVNPAQPDAKVKFLAAEAMRGCGGIILDANGKRFCDELGRRDYVSGEMFKNKGILILFHLLYTLKTLNFWTAPPSPKIERGRNRYSKTQNQEIYDFTEHHEYKFLEFLR